MARERIGRPDRALGPGTDTLKENYLYPVACLCCAVWAGRTIMISLAARVNTAWSKGLALLHVDMTATSKGDVAFARPRAFRARS